MSWTQVAAYNDRFEANLVIAKLGALGIPAFLGADDLAGNFPLMHLAEGGCRVLVPTDRLRAAADEITVIGRHALDTWTRGARRKLSDVERARWISYLIAMQIGWGLGYAPWFWVFGGPLR